MNLINEKYGIWVAAGTKFDNSYDAYLHATTTNTDVKFYYHHEIYKNFDISDLGKISLDELYRQRAVQLREKYDYLILYYSGGADSHNILKTFIDNNIHLDEVCVKWPAPLTQGKLYIPNSTDITAKNYWSEWDYAIKPILEWLYKNKPKIKITIKDYINSLNVNKIFEDTLHHSFFAGILLNSQVSDSEEPLLNKGKTVGNIYGLDKPSLMTENNEIRMFFTDNALRSCVRSKINPYGGECFYWDPNMPILAFEQAYQLSLHYKIRKEDRKFLYVRQTNSGHQNNELPNSAKLQAQNSIARANLYSNWDHRFQADKPSSLARLDKFFWFFEEPNLNDKKMLFMDNVKQRLLLINKSFLSRENINKNTTDLVSLKMKAGPTYYVNRFEDHD